MRARSHVLAGIVAAFVGQGLLVSVPALAATFFYVSNAEHGDIEAVRALTSEDAEIVHDP